MKKIVLTLLILGVLLMGCAQAITPTPPRKTSTPERATLTPPVITWGSTPTEVPTGTPGRATATPPSVRTPQIKIIQTVRGPQVGLPKYSDLLRKAGGQGLHCLEGQKIDYHLGQEAIRERKDSRIPIRVQSPLDVGDFWGFVMGTGDKWQMLPLFTVAEVRKDPSTTIILQEIDCFAKDGTSAQIDVPMPSDP